METDPLERIAVALVDEIRARKPANFTPVSLPQSPPNTPSPSGTKRKRERRVALYPAHYSLRITDEDRDRFDAYAERHRLAKGELFRRMLDALEAAESGKEK